MFILFALPVEFDWSQTTLKEAVKNIFICLVRRLTFNPELALTSFRTTRA